MAEALLVGAAPVDAAVLTQLYTHGNWELVIAIDGGYKTLTAAGIHPTIALGDFDSLGFVPADVPVERFNPIKDQSDMEIAYEYVRTRAIDTMYVLGALGARLDHTLASLMVFAEASEQGLRTIAVHEDQAVAFITGPATFTLPATNSGVVSLMAMNDQVVGVTVEGLAYELDDGTLTNRTSLGLSNEFIGLPATITVTRGTLAIFYPLGLLLGCDATR